VHRDRDRESPEALPSAAMLAHAGRVWLLVCSAVVLSACASGPRAAVADAVAAGDTRAALAAYERVRADEDPDPALLARVAGLVLEKEARSTDVARRDAAMGELVLAGTQGQPVLERIVASRAPPLTRALALAALATHGNANAKDELRAFVDSDDAGLQAVALVALDGRRDVADLLRFIESPHVEVRAASARQLDSAGRSARARTVLAEASRVDPEARVRAAATRSLGAFGPAAVPALRERLSDPDQSVRLAAVSALVRADREQALLALAPLLELEPSSAGIEAARVLARGAPGAGERPGVVSARAFLRRGLESADARLRAQAAVALASFSGDPSLDEALVTALRAEHDASTKLAIAGAIVGRRDAAEASRGALRELVTAGGTIGVQAASLLARTDDAGGARALGRMIRSDDVAVRRIAVRAMARDAMRPDAVRRALRDRDAIVRIRAAGGILAAVAAAD